MSLPAIDTTALETALKQFGRELRGRVEMVIGFNTVYAAVQHERLDFRHEPPGQAKYLEVPMTMGLASGLMNRAIAHHANASPITSASELKTAIINGVRDTGLKLLSDAQALAPVGGGIYSPKDPAPGTLKASAQWRGPEVVGG